MLSKSVRDQAHNIRAKRMEVRIDAIGLWAAAGCKANGGSPKGWAQQIRWRTAGASFVVQKNINHPTKSHQNRRHKIVAMTWLAIG